eukprot:6180665-Pleurochrysis_carterae.AAC.3
MAARMSSTDEQGSLEEPCQLSDARHREGVKGPEAGRAGLQLLSAVPPGDAASEEARAAPAAAPAAVLSSWRREAHTLRGVAAVSSRDQRMRVRCGAAQRAVVSA